MSDAVTDVDLDEARAESLRWAAKRVHARLGEYVSFTDLTQEGWAWHLSHPKRVDRMFAEVQDERDLTLALRRYGTAVERVCEKLAQSERAAYHGYSPDDLHYYSKSLLDEVLPALYSDDYALAPPQRGPMEGGSSHGDPALGGDWTAYVADVKAAYGRAKLNNPERVALYLKYAIGLPEEPAAERMGVSRGAYRGTLGKALTQITRNLQGLTPMRHTRCEDHPR